MRYSWENPLVPSDSWSRAIVDAVSAALRITSQDTHVLNENLLSSKRVLPPFPAVVEDGYYADAEDNTSDLMTTTAHPDYMISDLLSEAEDSDHIISV